MQMSCVNIAKYNPNDLKRNDNHNWVCSKSSWIRECVQKGAVIVVLNYRLSNNAARTAHYQQVLELQVWYGASIS